MNEYGELIAADEVRFRRLLPGPIERIWSYLTEAERRRQWLCDGQTEGAIGGRVDLIFRNAELSTLRDIDPPEKYRDLPDEVAFHGVVTRYEPPHVLAHTWVEDDDYTEVTYELAAVDDQVLLTLTHRRVATREMKESIMGGWHTHLNILVEVLNDRQPQPFWLQHGPLEEEYSRRLDLDR